MPSIKRHSLTAVIITAVALCLCLGLAACAPQSSSDASKSPDSSTAVSADGAYVSDEQCLSCHGSSYEALAKTTSDLGDWNPHEPIHGGYNSCNNCHAKDKEITTNYCEKCHTYAPSQDAA